MKKILILILVLISVSSFAQNTWVKWNGHLFLKNGNDSTHYGEDVWSIMPDIVTALNSKQPVLASGTNIKTIKNQPLTGNGNIDISWGDLIGTISTQSDLQAELNAKLAANGNGSLLTGLTKTQVGLPNADNTSDLNKPISTATQAALDAKQNTIALTTAGTSGAATLIGNTLNIPNYATGGGGGMTRVFLPSDQINNNAVANTIQDVTGLEFPVVANTTYQFRFVIIYSAAATTTGSRWCINGPATTHMSFTSQYPTSATAITNNASLAGYNLPAASNASSAVTTNNRCIIEGEIRPSANGTVIARFASEVLSSAITAVASGRSYVEYQIIN